MVSVVTTGGVILITRFAFLSPNEADSFSSNNPSPNTGVRVKENNKKRFDKIKQIEFCIISCEVWFHDHAGNLRIQMKPSNVSQVVVYGEQDPILNAYGGTADSPVIAAGPIFLEGGLYHFIVRIATVDYDRTMLPDDKQPVFDGYLSIGNVENYNATVGGKDTQIKMTSYYDKLRNVTFDNTEMKLGFDMPFDWNLSRIRNVNIFVHEEISIPKPNNFTSKGSYSGVVNGIDVSKQLVLDNSNPKEDVIHFMLPKDKLVSFAEQMANNSQSSMDVMKFSLKPSIENMTTNMTSMPSMS